MQRTKMKVKVNNSYSEWFETKTGVRQGDPLSAEENEIPKVPHQDYVDNFFDSQGVVHKEFVPEGKTVNTEFYKGVMDRLLKRIQWVHSAAFCSRDLFLLHDNTPAHKAARVSQFLTQKNVTTVYQPRTLQIYLRKTIFRSPS
jgi:hypothetical protein